MTCPACANAQQHPLSGKFHADCEGCCARALSRDPRFFVAAKEGRLTPEYRGALAQFFPKLPTHEAHARVKEWTR